MRLINTSDGTLQNFLNKPTPPYAILSHRWLEDELDFQDVSSGNLSKRPSLDKLRHATEEARRKGYLWLWVDTCCINKDSSAELSEAINSMYKWYQDAEECFAYLHDVHKTETEEWESRSVLQNSVWFYRGWTLQELLAPTKLHFYDRNWQYIGERAQLADEISSITGIRQSRLGQRNFQACSVAERMSWAAKRVTTRLEDQAYCLLGIFDVNMPLLHGEGEKAFIRLQEEIIKGSDDKSIFVWHMDSQDFSGLLAPGPASFDGCGDIICAGVHHSVELTDAEAAPFSMTNRGLSIELDVTPWSTDVYMAYLECEKERGEAGSSVQHAALPVFIFVKRLSAGNQYARFKYHRTGLRFEDYWSIWPPRRPYKRRRLFVLQTIDALEADHLAQERIRGFHFPREASVVEMVLANRVNPHSFRRVNLNPLVDERHVLACRYHDGLLTTPKGGLGIAAVVDVSSKLRSFDVILLGFDFDFNPVCVLQNTRLHLDRRDEERQRITSSDFADDKFVWADDGRDFKRLTIGQTDDRLAMRGTKGKNGFTATVSFEAGYPPLFLAMDATEFDSKYSQKWTLYLATERMKPLDTGHLSRSEWTAAYRDKCHFQAKHNLGEFGPSLNCYLDNGFESFTISWS